MKITLYSTNPALIERLNREINDVDVLVTECSDIYELLGRQDTDAFVLFGDRVGTLSSNTSNDIIGYYGSIVSDYVQRTIRSDQLGALSLNQAIVTPLAQGKRLIYAATRIVEDTPSERLDVYEVCMSILRICRVLKLDHVVVPAIEIDDSPIRQQNLVKGIVLALRHRRLLLNCGNQNASRQLLTQIEVERALYRNGIGHPYIDT